MTTRMTAIRPGPDLSMSRKNIEHRTPNIERRTLKGALSGVGLTMNLMKCPKAFGVATTLQGASAKWTVHGLAGIYCLRDRWHFRG